MPKMSMKAFICLLSFISIADGSLSVASSIRRSSFGIKTLHENQVQRSKRDILSEIPQIIQCSTNCIIPLITALVQQASSNVGQMNGRNFGQTQMTSQDMDQYCGVYRNASSCTDSCPSQSFKDTLMQATAIPRFICIERNQDFKTHLPCINQVGMETDDRCAAQCAQYDSIEAYVIAQINQTQRQFSQSQQNGGNPLDNFFGEMLKQSCQYSTCFVQCQRQAIISRCGPEAQRLVQDMISVSFKAMDDLSGAIGLSTDLPPECVQMQGTENGTMTNFTGSNNFTQFPNGQQQNMNQMFQQNQNQNQQNQMQNQQNQNQNQQNQNQNQQNQYQNQQNQNQYNPNNQQNQGYASYNQQAQQPYQQQQQLYQQYQGMGVMTNGNRQQIG